MTSQRPGSLNSSCFSEIAQNENKNLIRAGLGMFSTPHSIHLNTSEHASVLIYFTVHYSGSKRGPDSILHLFHNQVGWSCDV